MKTFLIQYTHKDKTAVSDELVEGHVNFLKKLDDRDLLLTCGPFVNGNGAILIIQSSNIDELHEIIKSDPFIKLKYYQTYTISKFTAATRANNFLAK